VFFMLVGVHGSDASDFGRKILNGVQWRFDDGAIGLANAYEFYFDRFTGAGVGKNEQTFGGDGGFGLDFFAEESVDGSAAVGFEMDFYGEVFDYDGLLGGVELEFRTGL